MGYIQNKLCDNGFTNSLIANVPRDHQLQNLNSKHIQEAHQFQRKLCYVKPTLVYRGKCYKAQNACIQESRRFVYNLAGSITSETFCLNLTTEIGLYFTSDFHLCHSSHTYYFSDNI